MESPYYNKEALAKSLKNKIKKPDQEIDCHICFTILRIGSLKNHMQRIHSKNEKLFLCQICDKPFPSQREVSVHSRRIHMKEENYKCNVCSRAFFRTRALTIHTSNFHQSPQQVKCAFCDIIVSNEKQLTQGLVV